jgi:hypothetical protein
MDMTTIVMNPHRRLPTPPIIIGSNRAYAASTFAPFSVPHSFHGIAAQT